MYVGEHRKPTIYRRHHHFVAIEDVRLGRGQNPHRRDQIVVIRGDVPAQNRSLERFDVCVDADVAAELAFHRPLDEIREAVGIGQRDVRTSFRVKGYMEFPVAPVVERVDLDIVDLVHAIDLACCSLCALD